MNEKSPKSPVTLGELTDGLSHWVRHYWKQRARMAAYGFGMAIIGILLAHFFREEKFESRVTFAVEEKTAGLGGLSGLANQLGMGLLGDASLFSADNLMLLLKSDRMIQNALLKPIPHRGDSSLFNDWLLRNYPRTLQKGDVNLIQVGKSRDQFTRLEDSVLTELTLELVEKGISLERVDRKASLINLKVKANDERWALDLSHELLREASSMYMDLKVGKTRKHVQILANRVDSVERAMNSAVYQVADEQDQTLGYVQAKTKVPRMRKEMEVQMLGAVYGELVKSYEMAKYALEREEPVIQIIDQPRLPLERFGKGRILFGLMFGFLGGVLGLIRLRPRSSSR